MPAAPTPVRFAALGLDHFHALGQVAMLLRSGAELKGWYGSGDDLSPLFEKSFPQVRAADPRAILEDSSIALVTCAAVPDRRARLAIEAMRHGKDVMVDKPGAVTLRELEELRAAQRVTGRIWTVFFSERLESRATVKAVELVRSGAIGRPLQTVGLGPHQLGLTPRPGWFWDPRRSGGILGDLFEGRLQVAVADIVSLVHQARKIHQDSLEQVDILFLAVNDEKRVPGLYGNGEQVLQIPDVFVEGSKKQLQTAVR